MKNIIKKRRFVAIGISVIIIIGAIIGMFGVNKTYAATVGQQLAAVEDNTWQRIDDTSKCFVYSGSWIDDTSNPSVYVGGKGKCTTSNTAKITFKFKGTKLRLITPSYSTFVNNAKITIDGGTAETYNEMITTYASGFNLVYEKISLTDAIHTVEIYCDNIASNKMMVFDAIDIDSNGYLIEPANITLDKTELKLNVGESATLAATVTPAETINKNVIWTSSDNTIASVDNAGKVTAGNKIGTAIINAKSEDSGMTATCSVTVAQEGRAILDIIMVNNERKEYDLSMSEISKFIDWYNGNTTPSYAITKNYNVKPFNSRTEYIAHDKVSSFEVNEYNDVQK